MYLMFLCFFLSPLFVEIWGPTQAISQGFNLVGIFNDSLSKSRDLELNIGLGLNLLVTAPALLLPIFQQQPR